MTKGSKQENKEKILHPVIPASQPTPELPAEFGDLPASESTHEALMLLTDEERAQVESCFSAVEKVKNSEESGIKGSAVTSKEGNAVTSKEVKSRSL